MNVLQWHLTPLRCASGPFPTSPAFPLLLHALLRTSLWSSASCQAPTPGLPPLLTSSGTFFSQTLSLPLGLCSKATLFVRQLLNTWVKIAAPTPFNPAVFLHSTCHHLTYHIYFPVYLWSVSSSLSLSFMRAGFFCFVYYCSQHIAGTHKYLLNE